MAEGGEKVEEDKRRRDDKIGDRRVARKNGHRCSRLGGVFFLNQHVGIGESKDRCLPRLWRGREKMYPERMDVATAKNRRCGRTEIALPVEACLPMVACVLVRVNNPLSLNTVRRLSSILPASRHRRL